MAAYAGDQVYTIEEIIKDKRTKSGRFFLCKWKGYSSKENTWEPFKNILDKKLIAEYDEAKRAAKAKKATANVKGKGGQGGDKKLAGSSGGSVTKGKGKTTAQSTSSSRSSSSSSSSRAHVTNNASASAATAGSPTRKVTIVANSSVSSISTQSGRPKSVKLNVSLLIDGQNYSGQANVILVPTP